ncbi:MAG: hypothetical protein JEZ09_21120 [Salinivirgaceae bacterium]|nr:hypothetical protein [Salinivirgaceae bacterium]
MWSQKTYRKLQRKFYLREAIKNQKKQQWLNKKTERQIQLIVSLFFIGLIVSGIYGTNTLLSWNYIFRIYLAIALILSFLPISIFPLIYKIQYELKILLVVCGLSPFLLALILSLNYTFSTFSHIETYKVKEFNVYAADRQIMVVLENNALQKHKEIRMFSSDEFHFAPDSAAFEIQEGLFNIQVVKNSYLINNTP